jgi:hypothetical protein
MCSTAYLTLMWIEGLEALGVTIMMLQFSTIEQGKEYHVGDSLISKLHNAASYFISTLPAQEYAMGHDAWNAVMKDRAVQTILPEILQVAQDYQEHLAQQGRDEGERETSLALGKTFTYTDLQKPVRRKGHRTHKTKVKSIMGLDNLLNAQPAE